MRSRAAHRPGSIRYLYLWWRLESLTCSPLKIGLGLLQARSTGGGTYVTSGWSDEQINGLLDRYLRWYKSYPRRPAYEA